MTNAPRSSPLLAHPLARAAAHHAAGDLAAAEKLYCQALEIEPDQADALAGLGAIAGQRGQAQRAVQYLERACARATGNLIFQHNLGEALRQMGDLPRAEATLIHVLDLDPGFVPAWKSLFEVVQAAHARASVARDPAQIEALTQKLAQVANNLGNAQLAQGDATAATESYRRAIALRADYAMAWSNLGNALFEMGVISEAESACRRALAIDNNFAAAWNNLGNALVEQGRYTDAQQCHDRAIALRPDFPEARHNRASGALFNSLYMPALAYQDIAALHIAWGNAYPLPAHRRWSNSRDTGRVLKIGYLSADFRHHAMSHFIEPLLARHDRAQFDIHCYAQGPRADDTTRRFMAYGHRWTWVHGLNDDALAATIEANGIDILIDCSGHTRGTRITALAGKPAPLIMSWLGYLCTSGLPAIDYRLTDAWTDPPEIARTPDSETLLRIPGGMLAYRPHTETPEVNDPPHLAKGHITLGSLNNTQKINRVLVALWAKVLHALPDARLLLQAKQLADPGVAWRLRGLFEANGITLDRLEFREASTQFLRTYHDIDIALDTLPYGGGTTTCDALWMGVPVITLASDRPAGRLSAGILHCLGRPEWVTGSAPDYVRAVTGLASDPAALARIRRGLRAQMLASALCDEAGFVRRLEQTYRVAWQGWVNTP